MNNSTDLAREGSPAPADAASRPATPRRRSRGLLNVATETVSEAPEETVVAAKRLLCVWLIAEYKTRNGQASTIHPP